MLADMKALVVLSLLALAHAGYETNPPIADCDNFFNDDYGPPTVTDERLDFDFVFPACDVCWKTHSSFSSLLILRVNFYG